MKYGSTFTPLIRVITNFLLLSLAMASQWQRACAHYWSSSEDPKTIAFFSLTLCPLASMAMVFAKKRASFYFYDFDHWFLENSIRIIVSIWVAGEYEAESNDCVALYRRGPLASMSMVFAKKRASFYFYYLDCRFLEKAMRIIVL